MKTEASTPQDVGVKMKREQLIDTQNDVDDINVSLHWQAMYMVLPKNRIQARQSARELRKELASKNLDLTTLIDQE